MGNSSITLTRVALALIAMGTVLMQILLPYQAAETGRLFPEVKHLVLPYSIAAVLMVACVQAVLFSIWKLLSRISRGTLYTKRSLKWVDTMRWAVLLGAGLPALVAGHLLFFVGLGGPGVVLGFASALVLGAAAFLLLTVLRRVFSEAKAEHAELAEVI